MDFQFEASRFALFSRCGGLAAEELLLGFITIFEIVKLGSRRPEGKETKIFCDGTGLNCLAFDGCWIWCWGGSSFIGLLESLDLKSWAVGP